MSTLIGQGIATSLTARWTVTCQPLYCEHAHTVFTNISCCFVDCPAGSLGTREAAPSVWRTHGIRLQVYGWYTFRLCVILITHVRWLSQYGPARNGGRQRAERGPEAVMRDPWKTIGAACV